MKNFLPVTSADDYLIKTDDAGLIIGLVNPAGATVLFANPAGDTNHAAPEKDTLVDADEFAILDSASSFDLAKTTWANIKAKILTAFDDVSGGLVGMTLFKINFKNAANTFTNFLTNATTAARTYTFPDKDLTVAGVVDITDAAIATTDVTTNNASTTKHGFALKAVAPSAGSVNMLGIANGETVYSMKTMPVLGTGIATALGINAGTTGAPVLQGAAASVTTMAVTTLLEAPVHTTAAAAASYAPGVVYFDSTLNKLVVGGATQFEAITSVGLA